MKPNVEKVKEHVGNIETIAKNYGPTAMLTLDIAEVLVEDINSLLTAYIDAIKPRVCEWVEFDGDGVYLMTECGTTFPVEWPNYGSVFTYCPNCKGKVVVK